MASYKEVPLQHWLTRSQHLPVKSVNNFPHHNLLSYLKKSVENNFGPDGPL